MCARATFAWPLTSRLQLAYLMLGDDEARELMRRVQE
jgi:hypothetical protein